MAADPRFDELRLETCRALGRGAFGEVFLVHASGDPDRKWALKRMPLAQLSGDGTERALSEARLQQQLGEQCRFILRCFDSRLVTQPAQTLEILMEYAALGDLSHRIRARREEIGDQGGGLSEAEVVSYGRDVAAGLAFMHTLRPKVFHRDVKPANVVLFPPEGGPLPRAKLADFGIAKVLEREGSFAKAKTVIGTPHYFSPEICRGEDYDERSDAWALGCVLFEMVCLRRPFYQAEHNIAVLCLRITEGRYASDLLAAQAVHYNGLLVFTLMGLLTFEVEQRHTAQAAMQALEKLEPATNGEPWWQAPPPPDLSRVGSGVTDSWVEGTPIALSAVLEMTGQTRLPELNGTLLPEATISPPKGAPMSPVGEADEAHTPQTSSTGLLKTQLLSEPSPKAEPAGAPSRMAWAGETVREPRPETAPETPAPPPIPLDQRFQSDSATTVRRQRTRLFLRPLNRSHSAGAVDEAQEPVVLCWASCQERAPKGDAETSASGWIRLRLPRPSGSTESEGESDEVQGPALGGDGIFSLTSLE